MQFGITSFLTDYSMQAADLAVAVEERGFDIAQRWELFVFVRIIRRYGKRARKSLVCAVGHDFTNCVYARFKATQNVVPCHHAADHAIFGCLG